MLRRLLLLAGCAALMTLAGCASTPPVAIYSDPDLAKLEIRSLTLLPVVDRRVDRSYELDREKSIGDRVEKQLRKKGYDVIRATAFSDSAALENDQVAEMEPRELARLGSAQSPFLLFVYLDDISSKTALGYTFKVEASSILVNRGGGNTLWKDKAVVSQGQGGLLGCMMSGAVKSGALGTCATRLVTTLPDTPEKGR
jgi:hypothetical protein